MSREAEFVMLQCENPNCRFRCPSNLSVMHLEKCPLCQSRILAATPPFTNQKFAQARASDQQLPLEVLLDNLRSTLNVGSIFRTADGADVTRIHLCGTTPTPEHPKIAKTGLGAEWNLPWEVHRNGLDFVREKQKAGFVLIALEAALNSLSIFDLGTADLLIAQPVLLVVGNEVSGIDPEILAEADHIISIPMHGSKSSLNVSVAFGIAVYTIKNAFDPSL